ncbi:hypothetical protein FOZ63_024214, partial [Perkinsus olseni]
GRDSLLEISDQEMCEAKPQTKWEAEASRVSEPMVERKIWTRQMRNSGRLTSEMSVSSVAISESHLKQPRARVAAKGGARARAASANTSAAYGSRNAGTASAPARAVRSGRAAAAVYEHENLSG